MENILFIALFIYLSNDTKNIKKCWPGEAEYFLLANMKIHVILWSFPKVAMYMSYFLLGTLTLKNKM